MQDRMANASLGAAVLAASASCHPGLFWSMRKACSLNSLTMVLVLADGLTVKLCSFESGYKAWDWPFPCLTALYLPNRGGQNLTITLNTQREYMLQWICSSLSKQIMKMYRLKMQLGKGVFSEDCHMPLSLLLLFYKSRFSQYVEDRSAVKQVGR